MGFFKDFKDDFSQAVNELMPGQDNLEDGAANEDLVVNTLENEVDVESELSKLDGLLEQVTSQTAKQQTSVQNQPVPSAPQPKPAGETKIEQPVIPENHVKNTQEERKMAVKTVQYVFNGQTYDLTLDASTGKYKATVPAPSKSSYSQDGHKYGGSVIATDDAGNSTTIDQSDATFGANLLLRVLEKVAPTLVFTYPTAGAYITNATPAIRFKVTDNDSGVNPDTIVIKVDGAKVTTSFTKTAVTGGYECSYTPGTALADGAHTISIEASDYDGNAATAKTVTFTIDTIPPTLTLTNPADGLITNKSTLVVSGKTDDAKSKPVTVTVNGASVAVNSDGSFSKEITLTNGSNTITVVAKDKAGKTTTVTRKVTLDTGAPVFKGITLTPNPVDCGKTFIISVEVTD